MSGTEIFQGVNLRKVAGINEQQPGQRADGNRGQQQQRESDASDNLAAAQAQRDRRQLYHEDFILTQIARGGCGDQEETVALAFLD